MKSPNRVADRAKWRDAERGVSLLEVMIVATTTVVLASIGIPQYQRALQMARVVKCKQDLLILSGAIDAFQASEGRLPLTLYEVGQGGRLDPWGVPYCFLNYQSGTGDGLAWAVEAGVVDPAALGGSSSTSSTSTTSSSTLVGPSPLAETPTTTTSSTSGSSTSGNSGRGNSSSRSGSTTTTQSSTTSTVAPQTSSTATSATAATTAATASTASSAAASSDLGVDALIEGARDQLSGTEIAALAQVLGRGVHTQIYSDVPIDTTRRRDQYLYPLNTDYDLFSLGPNGRSAAALNDPLSSDDVIRANNGGYFGVAANY